MAKKETRATQRRLRNSFLTSVVSIAMVLFLLGLVGFLLLNARQVSIYVKENIGFNVELKDNIREADMQQLKKILDAQIYVKSTEFVSKEEAAVETQKALGEDFIEFLGYNPLPATIKVKLAADYANPDSIYEIEKAILNYDQVNEIYYKKTLIHEINDNVRKISLVLVAFSVLLLIVSLTLINNTIRLSVYSRRFIIHTMQLVGATRGFIRRPFLWTGVSQGFLAAFLAIAMVLGTIYIAQKQIEEVLKILDLKIMALLFAAVLVTGIIISFISSFFSVNKYLNISKDELYYR